MDEENVGVGVTLEKPSPDRDARGALIDEVDAQIWMLGRLFSTRHSDTCPAGPVGFTELPMTQYVLLRVLLDMGPMKMADIASALGTKAPAVSALVDHAHYAGYVVREPDAEDRRVTRAVLTEAGRAAVAEVEAHRREMLRRYMSVLSEEDLANLIRIQRILIGALGAEKI
jgi:DNA-binding MarR family transcriptional regulator